MTQIMLSKAMERGQYFSTQPADPRPFEDGTGKQGLRQEALRPAYC